MKTIALYDSDAFAKEFTAKVISCDEVERDNKKLYRVILDKTLFFPEQYLRRSASEVSQSAVIFCRRLR